VTECAAEGQEVQIVVDTGQRSDIVDLATQVYEGLSDADVDEVERIALDRYRARNGGRIAAGSQGAGFSLPVPRGHEQ
jgi:hypothetical protein